MNTISKWLIASLALLIGLAVSSVQAQEKGEATHPFKRLLKQEKGLKLSPEAQALSKRLIENERIWGEYINKEKGIHKIIWSSVAEECSGIWVREEPSTPDSIVTLNVYVSDAKKDFATALIFHNIYNPQDELISPEHISNGIVYLYIGHSLYGREHYGTLYLIKDDLFMSELEPWYSQSEFFWVPARNKRRGDSFIYNHMLRLADGNTYQQKVEYSVKEFPKILREQEIRLPIWHNQFLTLPKEARLANKEKLEDILKKSVSRYNNNLPEWEEPITWDELPLAWENTPSVESDKAKAVERRVFNTTKLVWKSFPENRKTKIRPKNEEELFAPNHPHESI